MISKYNNKHSERWQFEGRIYKNGKLIHRYHKRGYKTKTEAKLAEAEYIKWYKHEGVPVPPYTLIVDDFLKYRKTQVKSSTYVTDLPIYTKFKDILVGDYTDKDFLQNLIDECDKKYSKKEVEKIYYALSKLFKWMIREEYLNYNPMIRVTRDARKNEMPKRINYWEPDEFKRFIDVIDDPMYKTAYMILYYMGLRKGELRALTWENVNLNNRTMTINQIVSNKVMDGEDPITTPKTKNSFRTISIPKILNNQLIYLYNVENTFCGFSDERFVIGGIDRPVPNENLRRHLKNGIREANKKIEQENEKNGTDIPPLSDLTIHGFRHSHASLLINNLSEGTFSDYEIAQRLGDTVQTLHSTYAHWFRKKDANVLNWLDNEF